MLGAHAEARSELRLTVRNGAFLEHLRLDRTFVDDGKRWIVDFKTSQHEGGDLDAFLDSEVERYRPQLERYARPWLRSTRGRCISGCISRCSPSSAAGRAYYSEPVRVSRRRPSASGSAVMTFRPSTSCSGALARGLIKRVEHVLARRAEGHVARHLERPTGVDEARRDDAVGGLAERDV